ncbi:MAG: hypothetical protein Q9170_007788 [Blastenia crenularia]
MLLILKIHLLISLYLLRVIGEDIPKSPVIVSATVKALPNPLIVPWANVNYVCTRTDSWLTTEWAPIDCAGAIQNFHDIEVAPKGETVYEFIQAGAAQRHPNYYGQSTPRQYTYGNCTMAILNMNDTKLGNMVPNKATNFLGYDSDDFSSYEDIWNAAKNLYRICSVSYGVPGWLPIGFNHSTGVFLYATNSTLDSNINGTKPDTSISDHLPQGWGYLGCNYDSANRALKNLSWSGENLSVERCAAYCGSFRYFGVEAGEE